MTRLTELEAAYAERDRLDAETKVFPQQLLDGFGDYLGDREAVSVERCQDDKYRFTVKVPGGRKLELSVTMKPSASDTFLVTVEGSSIGGQWAGPRNKQHLEDIYRVMFAQLQPSMCREYPPE